MAGLSEVQTPALLLSECVCDLGQIIETLYSSKIK